MAVPNNYNAKYVLNVDPFYSAQNNKRYYFWIYKEGYSGSYSNIEHGTGDDPIEDTIEGGRDDIEGVIFGRKITIKIHPSPDNWQEYDEFMSSAYKDYFGQLKDQVTGDVLFEGWLLPENIEANFIYSPYMIKLPFTDGLGKLKDESFIDKDDLTYYDADGSTNFFPQHDFILNIINNALNKKLGYELDYKIQMNTYEVNEMSADSLNHPTQCALKVCAINPQRFVTSQTSLTEGYIKDNIYYGSRKTPGTNAVYYNFRREVEPWAMNKIKDVDDCYTVLEKILTSFNATLTQVDGYWVIQNKNEINTQEFIFKKEDLTERSDSPSDITNVIELNDTLFEPFGRRSKIPPKREVYINYMKRKIGNKRSEVDSWDQAPADPEWDLQDGIYVAGTKTSEMTVNESSDGILDISIDSKNWDQFDYDEYGNHALIYSDFIDLSDIDLPSDYDESGPNRKYLKFRFTAKVVNTYNNYKYNPKVKIFIGQPHCFLNKDESTWGSFPSLDRARYQDTSHPKGPWTEELTGEYKYYESPEDENFVIIRGKYDDPWPDWVVDKGYQHKYRIYIFVYTYKTRTDGGATDTEYSDLRLKFKGRPDIRVEDTDDDAAKDAKIRQWEDTSAKGTGIAEATLYFGDAASGDEVNAITMYDNTKRFRNALSGLTKTSDWNRYGLDDGIPLLWLYMYEKMNNYRDYADMVTLGRYDQADEITPRSILKINSGYGDSYYQIVGWNKKYRISHVKLQLRQIFPAVIGDSTSYGDTANPIQEYTIDKIDGLSKKQRFPSVRALSTSHVNNKLASIVQNNADDAYANKALTGQNVSDWNEYPSLSGTDKRIGVRIDKANNYLVIGFLNADDSANSVTYEMEVEVFGTTISNTYTSDQTGEWSGTGDTISVDSDDKIATISGSHNVTNDVFTIETVSMISGSGNTKKTVVFKIKLTTYDLDSAITTYNFSLGDKISADEFNLPLIFYLTPSDDEERDALKMYNGPEEANSNNTLNQAPTLNPKDTVAPSHSEGKLWYNPDDGIIYRSDGSSWEKVATHDQETVAKNTFTIGAGDGSDVSLIFDDGSNHTIKWDNSEGQFDIDSAVRISGTNNLTVTGDLTVQGTEFISNTETVQIEDNLAIINNGEGGNGVTNGFAGWEVDRGGLTNYRWGFDESDDTWKLGLYEGSIDEMQAVATRQDSPTDGGVAYWNDSQTRLDTSSSLHWNESGKVLGLNTNTGTGLLEMKSTADDSSGGIRIIDKDVNNVNVQLYAPSDKGVLALSNSATIKVLLDANGDSYFDTDTLYIDSTNHRVGIGMTSPDRKLDVNGNIRTSESIYGGNAEGRLEFYRYKYFGGIQDNGDVLSGGSYYTYIGNGARHNAGDAWDSFFAQNQYVDPTALVLGRNGEFYFLGKSITSTGNHILEKRMIIDNTGNVGIGETIPDGLLHMKTSVEPKLILQSSDAAYGSSLRFYNENGTDKGGIFYGSGSSRGDYNTMYLKTDSTNRIIINGTGRVGIATSPDANRILDVNGNTQLREVVTGDNFSSGVLGSDWRIDPDVDTIGGSLFEVDNIRVRDSLRTHIFKKDIVRASNGFLYISDSSEVADNSPAPGAGASDTEFTLTVKDQVFEAGDLLWYKDIDMTDSLLAIYSVKMEVISSSPSTRVLNGKTVYDYTVDQTAGGNVTLKAGDTVVRISGPTILNDASSAYAPFIEMRNDDTNSSGGAASLGSLRLRLGQLNGSYHYTSSNYGLAVGDPAGDKVTIDETSVAFRDSSDNRMAYLQSDEFVVGNTGGNEYLKYSISSGFEMETKKFYLNAGTADLVIDSVNKKISINSSTFGANGLQMEFVEGSVKFHVGTGNNYLQFNSGVLDISAYTFTLDAGSGNLKMDSANKLISINDSTFGNPGIQLDYNGGNPRFFAGDASQYVKFDGSSVDIQANAFVMNAGSGDLKIDSANKKISINDSTFGNAGIQLWYDDGATASSGDDAVKFYVGDGSSNYLKYNDGALDISTDTFNLNAGTSDLVIDSANKKISINSSTFGSNGLQMEFVEGTAKFYVGGGNNYLKFDSGVLDVSAYTFTLDAGSGDLKMDSANKLISINDSTFGNAGIQLWYDDGATGSAGDDAVKFYVGDGSSNYLKYNGTNLYVQATGLETYIGSSPYDMALKGHSFEQYLTFGSNIFGNAGIQLMNPNSGSPKFYVGDGSNTFLKYESGTLTTQKITLETNNTNKRIKIDSSDNTLSFYDSNNNKVINMDDNITTLRDTQEAAILLNYYSTPNDDSKCILTGKSIEFNNIESSIEKGLTYMSHNAIHTEDSDENIYFSMKHAPDYSPSALSIVTENIPFVSGNGNGEIAKICQSDYTDGGGYHYLVLVPQSSYSL